MSMGNYKKSEQKSLMILLQIILDYPKSIVLKKNWEIPAKIIILRF